ncbi:MAG: hypothetical protein J6W06_09660, partial [Bacteroidales bacterium]|nr:hypothetical protein [Bacteroidales bacterium]
MNIVVCIKQVPDTTEVKLDPKTGTLIREGIPSIINPDDKGALELALQLKDKYNATVTVLTMGLPQADAALREALAMGVDRAILLTDRKLGGADTLATSRAIAGALRQIDFDLILAGRQAIDGDTAQVGPQIAEHLGLPQADAALREALAMGVDRAILLTDRKLGGADTLATSRAIAGALRQIDFDLILAGRQAIDGDTAQVGPQIAEHLGLPQ